MQIEYFMWGYQPHFQISVKVAAESIFQALDQKLIPKVFLLGVLIEDREDRHPICLEPEECGYDRTWFDEVLEMAKNFEAIDEERHIFHSHPIAQERHNQGRKIKALKAAVEQVINRHDYYDKLRSFCSWPVIVEGYRVFVVLQFDRILFDAHYALRKKMDGRYRIGTSLLDATIREFMSLCSDALTKPNPGASPILIDRGADEVIRAAGKWLMYTPAGATDNFDGLHGLFETCNAISSMRYEGEEGIGRIIIARQNHPNIESEVSFSNPVKTREYRAVNVFG
jgi:hypothetical protein